jgi:hypothetical protein
MEHILSTNQKALKLNLDSTIYGTFAEIGAGQDVAGHFFKAGAASGTVAKSMSAYDMKFSDSIYGKERSGRYVCQSRVEKMIRYEYDLLIERLEESRPDTKFFAFANTVVARNYFGTNNPHGWLGLRFRHEPNAKHSDIIIHVRMHDNTNIMQQKALGTLGVNLVYSAFNHDCNSDISEFVGSLMEGLTRDRIEIDMIYTKGPALCDFDNRLLNLQLVKSGFTDAIMFDADGRTHLASDYFYKKNVLLARGSYRPPTKVNVDILKTGLDNFSKEIGERPKDIITMAEITVAQLSEDGEITNDDFLARVDMLNSIDTNVLVTNFAYYYELSNFMAGFRCQNIGLVLGAYNFMQIFEDKETQEGGILAALGMLFRKNVKVLIYPYREESETDELIQLENLPIKDEQQYLLSFIQAHGQVKNLTGFNDKILHIYSRKVLKMIRTREAGWEDLVPKDVAKTIKKKCLFGYPCDT